MLVEDDPNDSYIATRQLSQMGVECYVAKTNRDAIDLLNRYSFDVVFLDLKLDHESGLDVITHAKNSNMTTIFITLTGIDDKDPMIAESLNRGAAFVIRKPLSHEHVKTIFGQIT